MYAVEGVHLRITVAWSSEMYRERLRIECLRECYYFKVPFGEILFLTRNRQKKKNNNSKVSKNTENIAPLNNTNWTINHIATLQKN